jgi:pyruvoyl-dependent arginine decarboxylase (PvlArgDC)
MKSTKLMGLLFLMCAVLLIILPAFAESRFGPRIPTTYFVTTETGESDQGIPPDPYENFSYDLALLDAEIENFNVVYYTSVLPPESNEVPIESVKHSFHHGAVLETIMAKAGAKKETRSQQGLAGYGLLMLKGKLSEGSRLNTSAFTPSIA